MFGRRKKTQRASGVERHPFGVISWYNLLVPERTLRRRVWRRAVLDGLRNKHGEVDLERRLESPGDRREDGFYYPESSAGWFPPAIGEVGQWTISTLQSLGATAQVAVGWHNGRIEGLKTAIAVREHRSEDTEELTPTSGAAVVTMVDPPGPRTRVTASRPEAQDRRRARAAAQVRAAEQIALQQLKAELAEAIALRAAEIRPLRETAMQVQAFGYASMHYYWAVRSRWSWRRKPPVPAYVVIPLSDWVVSDDAVFDVQPRFSERAA
jgi:hypothetical protein